VSDLKKYNIQGEIRYKGKKYGVLNAPLNDEIIKKLSEYQGEKRWIDSSAPWKTPQLFWELEEGKLYLVKLYTDGLLDELMGSSKVLAVWVDELILFVEDKAVCKTYERKNSYLKEKSILQLSFVKGFFLSEEKQTKLYTAIEIKNNVDRSAVYTTFHMDSNDLLIYLEDDMESGEDQLLPLFTDFIHQMLDEDDEISLDKDELKEVLMRGDDTFFAYVKGKDVDKIVGSLISTLTNENLLSPKGCLLHLTINKKYSRKYVIRIIEKIDHGLEFDYEPLKPELKAPFYAGTRFVDGMDEHEVSIMILVSI